MPIERATLIFVELAVALLLAVILGNIARFLRQPLILAYILSGILISTLGFFRLGTDDILPLMASFGVVFLLFLVGLELRISDLKHVGKSALLTGIGQLLFTFLLGFVIIRFFGFGNIESFYISVALTFSSTIIVVKLLTEKKDLNSLYGKIAIGFLLVQDTAAVLFLIFLSAFDPTLGQNINVATFSTIFLKGAVIILAAVTLNRFVLPVTFTNLAHSTELLFIAALSWCFIFASLTKLLGFSLEIGAFIAGVALASSPFHLEISSRVRPMRDFFIVIFFIFLGTNMIFSQLQQNIVPIILLSAFILIGNPLIVLAIMGFLGHSKRTSFLASVTVAQISEFSLIVVALGQRVGHISAEIVSMVAAIGVVTIAVSSYMIIQANWLYEKLAKYLDIFERKHVKEARMAAYRLENYILIAGCEQVGRDILRYLEGKVDKKDDLVVVDFNPAVIENLKADGVNAVFGDIGDYEFLDQLSLKNSKLIISTIPDVDDNSILIKAARKAGFTSPLIVTSYWAKDAVKLYELGADFVLVPELAGGAKIIRILSENWENLAQLRQTKSNHLEELLEEAQLQKKATAASVS